jgi:uncharacterized membrane protein
MNAPRPASQVYGLTTNRLEALSDGVLAIVVTLLVLDFLDDDKSLAQLAKSSNREVIAYLCSLWPHVVGYVLSFVLIVIYWILHHVMFHHIRRVDRGLLWLNAMFLMTVAFLPFPADLLAECMFHESSVIVAIYGAAHLIVGLSLAALWLHASRGRRLLAETTDPETIRLMTRMALASPAIYTVGALVSFVSMPAGLVMYALAPAIFILPGRLDRLWLCSRHTPCAVSVDDSLRESHDTWKEARGMSIQPAEADVRQAGSLPHDGTRSVPATVAVQLAEQVGHTINVSRQALPT